MVPDMPPGAGHALPAVSNPRAEPREMSGADARHEVNDTTGLVRRRKGRDMRRQAEIRCLDQVVLAGSPRAKPLPCGSPRRSGCFPMRRRSFWRASLRSSWCVLVVHRVPRGLSRSWHGSFVAAVGLAGLFAGLADLGAGNALIRLYRHVVVATGAMIRTAAMVVFAAAVGLVALVSLVLPSVLSEPTATPPEVAAVVVLVLALGVASYALTDSMLLALGHRRTLLGRSIGSSVSRIALLILIAAGSQPSFVTLGVAYGVPLGLSVS